MDLTRMTDATGNPVWQVTHTATAAEVLDLYDKITANLAQLQTDAGITTPPTPVPPPVVTPPQTTYPTFTGPTSTCKGITPYSTNASQVIRFFKFGDNLNTSSGSTNQYVYGANVLLYWSQLNPKQNTYDWSALEKAIQPWVANGKKVILRISACGEPSWNPPVSAQGTPQWVLDLGVKSYKNSKGAVVPAYWDAKFKAQLQAFIAAMGAQYNHNASIEFIQCATGMGGECKPDTSGDSSLLSNLQKLGWNNDVWMQYIKDTISYYKAAFPGQRLAIQSAAYFNSTAGGTKYSEADIVNYAITQGLGLQNDGIGGGSKAYATPDPNWKRAAFISAEQRDKTAQTGTLFECDVEAMLSYCQTSQPIYCLCFADDLLASGNQAVLQKYAAVK